MCGIWIFHLYELMVLMYIVVILAKIYKDLLCARHCFQYPVY